MSAAASGRLVVKNSSNEMQNPSFKTTIEANQFFTSSSAMAERPRDAC